MDKRSFRNDKENNEEKVSLKYVKYNKGDLMNMDPVCLRALFRERIHHNIEVELYPILLKRKQIPKNFGSHPKIILDVWRKRGLPEDGDDFEWGKKYIAIADKIRAGKAVDLDESIPSPFNEEELKVVHKLLWERRSVRDWIVGKPIPDEMIEKILEAGRAAPTGCNLNIIRFIIIKDPETARMVWSDIPTPVDQCVIIVICYDTRIYKTVGQDQSVPHNMLFDCAAAADHMCLMAHALGLGAVWLSCTKKTAKTFKERYGLPEHMEQALHIAVGWTAISSIKSGRMPLKDMMFPSETSL